MTLARSFIAAAATVAASALGVVPASAQSAAAATQQAPARMDITKEERATLAPVQRAIKAQDWVAAQAALPAAVQAAHSPDARYALGHFELEIGLGRKDVALQARGLDDLIASGRVPAAELPIIYRNRGVLANNSGDKSAAEAAFAKQVELEPQSPDALVTLAQVKADLDKPLESVRLIERAIGLKRSAGASADETWYKYGLKISYDGRKNPALRRSALGLARDLVAAYPTPANWRDALIILRDARGLDPGGQLDVLRLMRASGALAGERDWYDLADGLMKAGSVAGAKAVLDEGTGKGAIDPKKTAFAELIRAVNDRLAGNRDVLAADESKAMAAANGTLALQVGDAWSGYGEQAKAIALYRAALGKTGVDSQEVKAHLAMALLASGDRAGAEALFKSLTGSRKELGAYWVLWLRKS